MFHYYQTYLLEIVALTLGLLLMAFVVSAMRRSSLNPRYAILWLGAGFVMIALSVYRPLLDYIAHSIGISYPPSLLFLVAFVFLLFIVLHYSLVLSSHRDSIRRLAQTVAMLEQELRAKHDSSENRKSCRSPPPQAGERQGLSQSRQSSRGEPSARVA